METPLLETARLRLRGHYLTDLAPFVAMWQEPQFYQHLTGSPLAEEEVWTKMLRHAGLWALGEYGYWAVEERATGDFIGAIGFGAWQRAIEPSIKGFPEIGWVLAPHTHGRGYATEAAQVVFAWGDAHLRQPRTVCLIDRANAASRRLAAKFGYQEFDHSLYKGHEVVLLERWRPAGG
ncbi:N-acetyltransferase [Hymenobacter sp. UV11]|uniref:GNAT family N-acetyltransferase n=1 Tax=Hymenobacter sp. UV11 TaxID=1849735 RepID=UPI00105CB184|nr:GNAT family N-acetyltransferase [Hymenobacter sp. UV11]TDN37109.1 acetyltransferase [Hymenobacter sp. UV11]TFZ67770.1 N-acetyltransferase [Hymenobacter sp. UV11]